MNQGNCRWLLLVPFMTFAVTACGGVADRTQLVEPREETQIAYSEALDEIVDRLRVQPLDKVKSRGAVACIGEVYADRADDGIDRPSAPWPFERLTVRPSEPSLSEIRQILTGAVLNVMSIDGCATTQTDTIGPIGPFRYEVIVSRVEIVRSIMPERADFFAFLLRGMATVDEVVGLAVIKDWYQLDTTYIPIVRHEGKLAAVGGRIDGM